MSDAPSAAPGSTTAERLRRAADIGGTVSLINLALAWAGLALSFLAYQSFLPALAAGIFFMPIYLMLLVSPLGGAWERRMFARVFAVGWVMLGVAGIYAELLSDPHQLSKDAGHFYRFSSEQAAGLRLREIRRLSEGAFAIAIWREVYDAFAFLGFPKERYIGVLVNVTAVASTGVLAVKTARHVYGDDPQRLRRLVLLVSCCGLFWLFAAIHLRDGAVLLAATTLVWIWVWFLSRPDLGLRLCVLVGMSALFSNLLTLLRAELFFAPFALAAAGTMALVFGTAPARRRQIGLLVSALGLFGATVAASLVGTRFLGIIDSGRVAYTELSRGQHSEDSLGMMLIVDQPLPIRMVLGTIYLYVFPIPAWVGFQLESAYNLFLSFNTIFFYFVIPLLMLSLGMILRNRRLRTPSVLFLLFSALGFSVAVAVTSLEPRHLGAFLIPVFVIALLPDLTQIDVRRSYRLLLLVFLAGASAVHLAWLTIKF